MTSDACQRKVPQGGAKPGRLGIASTETAGEGRQHRQKERPERERAWGMQGRGSSPVRPECKHEAGVQCHQGEPRGPG